MNFNIVVNPVRPNQLDEVKNEAYHNKFARWTLNGLNDLYHREFILKSMTNWSFYKGGDGQWIFDEDLEGFFLDESGDVRNRLKWTKNLIRPMVEQYVGNAIRLSYNARAKTFGDFVVNRREKEMLRLKGFHKLSKLMPDMKDVISDRVPIRETEEETMEDFDLMFDDNLTETINNLLTYIEKDIDIVEIKVRIAKFMAINGIGIYKGYESNMKYCGEAIDPMFFFFDHTAIKPDLSDAAYQGQWYWMNPSSIYERFQDISAEDRESIEKSSVTTSINAQSLINQYYTYGTPGGRIPVYETYWRDTEPQEYGYVLDDYGYAMFVRINTEESKYKTKDVIEPPKNEKTDKLFSKGKKTTKIYVDTLRYCIFVPSEQIGAAKDIILEWGELPYQETNRYDPSSVQYPFKVYTWNYDKGQIVTPLDDAINPQRLVNRMYSVAESQINNSGVSGTAIAAEAINPRDGEEGTKRAVNTGKPIVLETVRTGSIQNSIGQYSTTLNPNVFTLFNTAKEFQMSMGDVTGINESMMGAGSNADTAVGVTQANIGRGSLIQEPFYYGITKVLEQAYQHMATVGKKIYYDSPRRMAMIAGDGGYEILTITKDHMLEDFRIDVERTENVATLRSNADALVWTLYQAQLIDPYRFSMLLGRATPDQVTKSFREYQTELLAAKNQQDNINQQRMIQEQEQMGAMQQQEAGMMQQQQDLAIAQDERDKEHELQNTALKEESQTERTIIGAELNNRNNLQNRK